MRGKRAKASDVLLGIDLVDGRRQRWAARQVRQATRSAAVLALMIGKKPWMVLEPILLRLEFEMLRHSQQGVSELVH